MIAFYIDYIAAIVVIICLFAKFKNRWFWLIYGVACYVYIWLNCVNGLGGQALLNAIGGTIAFWNAFTFKATGDKVK